MGSSASRAQPAPSPAEPPRTVPDQNWDALERFKHSRSAMWTDETASIVEHNLRRNWDPAPRPDENRCRCNIRVDATYDYYYHVMVKWLGTPLQTLKPQGRSRRSTTRRSRNSPRRNGGGTSPRSTPRATTWMRLVLPEGGPGVDRFTGTGTRHGRQGGRTRASRPVGRGPMAQGRLPGSPGWPRERRKPPAR